MLQIYCRDTLKESTGSNQEIFGIPTSAVISLTHYFSPSVEFQNLFPPGKGGVKEMPVQNDSIIICI